MSTLVLAGLLLTVPHSTTVHAEERAPHVASTGWLANLVGTWISWKPGSSSFDLTVTRSGDVLEGQVRETTLEGRRTEVASYRIVLSDASATLRLAENGAESQFKSATLQPDVARFERKIKGPGLFRVELALLDPGTLSIVKAIGIRDGFTPAQTAHQRFQRISASP